MFFIFLNSFFTCFIAKFASFFGLKKIYLLCSELDRIFQQRELLCPNHVAEIASLSFCKTHLSRRLVLGVFGSRGEKRFWFRVLVLLQETLGRKTLPFLLACQVICLGENSCGQRKQRIDIRDD